MNVRSSNVLIVLALLCACSGKTKGVEDARKHPQDSAPVTDPTAPPPSGKGDVQLRVEWKDVPLAARASSGRTPCNTPRAASVAPTTTWGIPDVFVMIDAPPATTAAALSKSRGSNATGSATTAPVMTAAAMTREARVVLDHCALTPRVALASDKLIVASAAESPAKVVITKAGAAFSDSAGTATSAGALTAYLPIAGHSIEVGVDAKAAYHVEIVGEDGKSRDAEDAWVVVADSPFVAITEASGQVLLRDVPAGTYTATAWLPPRAGQPAKIAHAQVVVTDGGLADVTLDISK
ncbi:MAG TPA: hypothetical protein VMZ53_04865 [Kofleriaceae bacterium]|nr:hypothetical protein [Kofleriaceae bacterium]